MSAKDQIRQQLDELMGTGWDGAKNTIHYSDPKVCRCFLLGLCPHEALAGTKMAMGSCSKIHNYALKADFENSSKTCRSNQHRFYELTVLTYLQKVIRSCEILDRAKKGRLTRCQSAAWNGRISDKEAEMKAYGDLVDKKLIEAEELGSQGKVTEALAVIKEVERLKRRRSRIERYLDRKPNEPAKEQKQNICEECQLCIGLDDNEQRVANHSSGRLHNSILAIRKKIAELASSLESAQLPGDWLSPLVEVEFEESLQPQLLEVVQPILQSFAQQILVPKWIQGPQVKVHEPFHLEAPPPPSRGPLIPQVAQQKLLKDAWAWLEKRAG
ncbi:hypothetical protein HPB48_005975 [Haemaphysalis longicornis]|uniref:Uncharacterized protein n=1 Tax=Haemaphysalis longicornis TaxID=44386 RepID=A0A9J6FNA6_HAELO|nr:hypothetical protein HPB48_005975 [Haemaphysalis longicornis]